MKKGSGRKIIYDEVRKQNCGKTLIHRGGSKINHEKNTIGKSDDGIIGRGYS